MWAFTRNVVGERSGIEVSVLIPGHQGPHDYHLTPGDLRKISAADLLVANGYGLEEFIVVSARTANPGLRILEAGTAAEPIHVDRDGRWVMGGAHREGGHHHDHHGINPHPFASPREAAKMVRRIGEELAAIDPEGAAEYRRNAEAYAGRLEALADEFREVAASSPNPRVITHHNAFDYLARDSGLVIVAVIETVPGQAPSAGELNRLAEKARSEGVVAVFSEPQFSDRLARVLSEEAGIRVESLDPAATGEMRPDYYETVMRKNLETLRRVLSAGND